MYRFSFYLLRTSIFACQQASWTRVGVFLGPSSLRKAGGHHSEWWILTMASVFSVGYPNCSTECRCCLLCALDCSLVEVRRVKLLCGRSLNGLIGLPKTSTFHLFFITDYNRRVTSAGTSTPSGQCLINRYRLTMQRLMKISSNPKGTSRHQFFWWSDYDDFAQNLFPNERNVKLRESLDWS